MEFDTNAIAMLIARWNVLEIRCPLCGQSSWGVIPKVFEVREYGGKGAFDLSGAIYPLVAMACGVCGYTMFLSAVGSGAIPEFVEEESDSQEDKS